MASGEAYDGLTEKRRAQHPDCTRQEQTRSSIAAAYSPSSQVTCSNQVLVSENEQVAAY